nr:GFA family protein [uncultured Tateyamaria sp.]
MTNHKGGCLCGAITYNVAGPLRQIIACHCIQCRKTSGHYVAATQTATASLTISGAVTWYQSSDKARRGFCGTCGSPLFWQPGNRAVTSLFAGGLDGPTRLKIVKQIHTEAKGDYYALPHTETSDQDPCAG